MRVLILLIFFLKSIDIFSQVDSIPFSSCKYTAVGSNVQNRIVSMNKISDSIHYKIGIIGNCVLDSTYFLSLIWIDEATLDLQINYRNEEMTCNCYFELEFSVFRSNENRNPQLTYYNTLLELSEHFFKVVPEKFEIYEGDTINYSNHNGFKNGRHISFDESGKPSFVVYYNFGREVWDADFDEDGSLYNISFYSEEEIKNGISENRLNRLIKKHERNNTKRKHISH